MEVAVAVAWDAELKLFPLTVTMPGSLSITLIARILRQKLAAFSDHHTLKHDLHQIVKTIFLLCMLAHLLRNLFLCKKHFL